MNEKEFDEKYKKYLKESIAEIQEKYDEKRSKLKEESDQSISNIQKKYENKDNYDKSAMLTDFFTSSQKSMNDMLRLEDKTNNAINKRILKKFLTNE